MQKEMNDNAKKVITKAEEILSALGDGVSIQDTNFIILYQNTIHKKIFGNHIGEYCYRAYRLREGVCEECPIAATFKDGQIHTPQREIHTGEGTIYAEITASPLKDSKGNIIAGIEVVRDITDLRKAQAALQNSEENYRTTIDFLDDALHVADDNLNILLINKKLLEWNDSFGLDTDVIGKNVFEVYPFLSSKVQEEYKSVFKTGNSIKTEESAFFHGGEVITETKKIPIFEASKVIKVITLIRDITKRKLAEEALKESEQRYRNVYNTAPLAFVLWDKETRVTGWNNQAEQMFGWSCEEIVGQNFFDYIIPESARIRVQEIVKLLLEGKMPHYSINENITKSGRIIVCEWNNSIIRDSGDNVVGVISLGLDITERKQAEESLRENEERLESIFRASPIGIGVVSSPDRILLKVNERLCAMLGYSSGDLVGKSARVLYQTEEDFSCVGRRKYELIKAHGVGTVETRWKRKDGRILDILLSSSPIDKNNLSLGVTFTAMDITEKKRAEDTLKKSKQQIHMLLDSTAEAIYGIDLKGICTFVNAACLSILGYADERQVLGKNMHTLIHAKYPDGSEYPEEKCKIFQAFQRGEKISVDDEIFWKADGTSFPAEYWSYPIEEEGNVTGAVVTFIDITERKKAEELDHMRTDQIILNKEALLELTRMQTPDLETFSKIITLMCSQVLGVERVSIWFFNSLHTEITCEALYILSKHVHEKGLRLRDKDYPKYFKALEEYPVLAAKDAHTDPRTNEFAGQYLKPLGILSMMDIPMRRHGQVIGVICYESTESRLWSYEDQSFAVSVSHIATSALEDFERRKAEEGLRTSARELKKRVKDLEDFYAIAVNRELRMKELKEDIAALKEELEKYKK